MGVDVPVCVPVLLAVMDAEGVRDAVRVGVMVCVIGEGEEAKGRVGVGVGVGVRGGKQR